MTTPSQSENRLWSALHRMAQRSTEYRLRGHLHGLNVVEFRTYREGDSWVTMHAPRVVIWDRKDIALPTAVREHGYGSPIWWPHLSFEVGRWICTGPLTWTISAPKHPLEQIALEAP